MTMSNPLEDLIDPLDVAFTVRESDIAIGHLEIAPTIQPTLDEAASLFAHAFVEDETFEIDSIDSSSTDTGTVTMGGHHRGTGSRFTFSVNIENIQPVIEG